MLDCIDHGRKVSLAKEGYALVAKPGVSSRCVALHRLVYCTAHKLSLEGIDGKVVRHTCDNPRCINPNHLLLGSRADNNRDRADRGRSAKLIPSRYKLTRDQALLIQKRYVPKRHPTNGVSALAREFRVDTNVIYRVVKGEHPCLA